MEIAKIESGKDEILNYILETILKLWHPFMPFVTESIWQNKLQVTSYKLQNYLMIEKWPEVSKVKDSKKAVIDFEIIKNIITGIRSLRAEHKIEPVKKLNVVINAGDKTELFEENKLVIVRLARLEDCKIERSTAKPADSIGFVISGIEVFIDLSGTVDVEKETNRLNTEIAQLEKYLRGLEQKLNNQEFVNNAPPAVVDKEKQKLSEAKEKREKLTNQLKSLV